MDCWELYLFSVQNLAKQTSRADNTSLEKILMTRLNVLMEDENRDVEP